MNYCCHNYLYFFISIELNYCYFLELKLLICFMNDCWYYLICIIHITTI